MTVYQRQVLDRSDCEHFVTMARGKGLQPGRVYADRNTGVVDHAQYHADEAHMEELGALMAYATHATRSPYVVREAPRIVRYGVGGHFAWHRDASPERGMATQRRATLVLQLSDPDDYDGGVLEVRDGEDVVRVSRDQGTLAIFEASLVHRVTPVTSGERFALVCWGY